MPEVPLEEMTAAGDDALVVDVREDDEYTAGHVPGAVLIPMGTLPERMSELPRDQPVYLFCGCGGRAGKAAELLTAAGYDARSVAGGTRAWVEAGGDVATGPAPR